jgi:hypothetical protein
MAMIFWKTGSKLFVCGDFLKILLVLDQQIELSHALFKDFNT